MKPNKLLLGAIVAIASAVQPALADAPQYIFQYAKKGVKVTETGSSPVKPGTNPGTPVAEKVELSHQSVAFDGVWVSGPTVTKHVTVTNKSDQQVSFTFDVTGSASFTATSGCASLAPGAACDVQIVFAPTEGTAQSAALRVATADGTTKSVQLTGTGRLPSVTLSTPTFANAVLPSNTDVTAVARLTNNSYQFLTVNPINFRTAFSPMGMFSLVGSTCPPTMNPESSCDITVRLGTSTSGPRNATLNVNTSAGKLTAPLSGMVIGGTATLSESYVSFEAQEIDVTSAPKSIQLSNTGNAALNVSSLSFVTNEDSFGRSNTCGTTLQPGQSCTISVAFTPKRAEFIQGEMRLVHDGNGQTSFSAYGTGVLPPIEITSFNVPKEIKAGQPATITWATKNAMTAEVTCNNATVTNGWGLYGSATIVASHVGWPLDCGIFVQNVQGYTKTVTASITVVE